MKRFVVVITRGKLLMGLGFCLAVLLAALLLYALSFVFNGIPVFENIEEDGIHALIKENSSLESLFASLIPREQEPIYEADDRNISTDKRFTAPPPLTLHPLKNIILRGEEVSFRVLLDEPDYLRPVYAPDWKGFYFRSWLYLPYKNMEARHKIFAFSMGGSSNFDLAGSLGFNPENSLQGPMDNHRNINFILYGFQVEAVKVFENQAALVGRPRQTGASIVSITQDDLLPEGTDTKDFIFQLSTPDGYEVDYLRQNIIRYEYLKKQIEENTVHGLTVDSNTLDGLMKANAALKKELGYFIPLEDGRITQQYCEGLVYPKEDLTDIPTADKLGRKIPFIVHYENPKYQRPLYHPLWQANHTRGWSYIPRQMQNSLHRLLPIPRDKKLQRDFYGAAGFYVRYPAVLPDRQGFLIYNFKVSKATVYKNQLLLEGTPSRSGAWVISVYGNEMKKYDDYLVKLVTPDHSEIDCNITP